MKRIRRPVPSRTAPHRSWQPPAASPAQQPAEPGSPAGGAGPRAQIEATVSKSVELGYKVIDEYLQQGQRAAQRLNAGSLTAEAVATEAQDLGTRVARYASDFFGSWMELLELAAAGRAARPDLVRPPVTNGAGPEPPRPSGTPDVAPTSARLEIELHTSRATRLRLDVHADRLRGALRAHALRSADPKRGRLDDVLCTLDGDAPVVHLTVPGDQRAGSYEGLLIDEATNRPVGSLRITLGNERSPRSAQPKPSRKARASSKSPSSKPSSKRR